MYTDRQLVRVNYKVLYSLPGCALDCHHQTPNTSFSPIEDTSNAWPLNHNNDMITIIFRLCICLTEEIFGATEISLLP